MLDDVKARFLALPRSRHVLLGAIAALVALGTLWGLYGLGTGLVSSYLDRAFAERAAGNSPVGFCAVVWHPTTPSIAAVTTDISNVFILSTTSRPSRRTPAVIRGDSSIPDEHCA
jgi:hypothetical protein